MSRWAAMVDGEEKIDAARKLGEADRQAGREMRDMDDEDSAWLMDQVGETGPTTEANHPLRWQICEGYADGYECA
jgi:hypothetical protein